MFLFIGSKNIKNKKIILRTDLNIAIASNGKIVDNFRIDKSLPTIKYLLKNKNTLIIVSHLGRPNGKRVKSLSLLPIVKNLAKLLNKKNIKTIKLNDFDALKITKNLFVLENIRFLPGEEKNDTKLASDLAKLGDIFVEDGFGVVHRKSVSTYKITNFLPYYYGFLVKKEIENLNKILKPKKPMICILGGAKVSDKIMTIEGLVKKADYFLLGGVMANTFLKAISVNVKNSLVEKTRIFYAKKLLKRYPKKFILPEDFIWRNKKIVDIGPKTIRSYIDILKTAKTIFWNGNLGKSDKIAPISDVALAKFLTKSKSQIVISGGNTISSINKGSLNKKNIFLSTGGGATLEFLAGKNLPGLKRSKNE